MSFLDFLQLPILSRRFTTIAYEPFKTFLTSSEHSTNRLVVSLAAVCAAGYYLISKKPVDADRVSPDDDSILKILTKIDKLSRFSPPSNAPQAIDTHRKTIAALKQKLQGLIQTMILEYYQIEKEKVNNEKQLKHFTKDHSELMRNFSEKSTKVHSMLKTLTAHKESLWAKIQGSKKIAKDFHKIYEECYDTAFECLLEQYHDLLKEFSSAYLAIFENTHNHLLEIMNMESDTYNETIEKISLKFQSTRTEMLSELNQLVSANKQDILADQRDLIDQSFQSFQQNTDTIDATRKTKLGLDELSKELKDLTESNSTGPGHNTIASLQLLFEQLNTYESDLLTHDKTNLFRTVVEFIERHADYCQTLKTEVSSLLTIKQLVLSPAGYDSPVKAAADNGGTPKSPDQHLALSPERGQLDPTSSREFITPNGNGSAPSKLTSAALKALDEEAEKAKESSISMQMTGKMDFLSLDQGSTGSAYSPSSGSVTSSLAEMF
ncbi:MAG: hypothetical protein VX737_04245 [Pseudomonadota bacterium]|nr:hypothetical protein [Pseudomonadota bacterium]